MNHYQPVNRYFNSPSPVVFPSASPTPKLYNAPNKKLPVVHSWQEEMLSPQDNDLLLSPFHVRNLSIHLHSSIRNTSIMSSDDEEEDSFIIEQYLSSRSSPFSFNSPSPSLLKEQDKAMSTMLPSNDEARIKKQSLDHPLFFTTTPLFSKFNSFISKIKKITTSEKS